MNQIIETKVGKIEYDKRGKGKTILFVHGGHDNCRGTLWHKGLSTDQFQLITPSRPGYGQTPLASFSQPKEAAALIMSMVDVLGLEEVVVIGISAGGLTAIELAANYPDKVSKLVLMSAVTKKWLNVDDKFYKHGKRMFSPKRENITWKMFRFFFKLFPGMMTKTLFSELSTKKNPSITKDEIAEIKEMSFNQRSGSGFEADLDHDIETETISKIKCPTLILHSENDKSVKMEFADHANEAIPNSELITYDNKWGHLLWVGEDSKKPIEDLVAFLNK